MGATLTLSVSVSNTNATTAKVTATLKIKATGETWNGYSNINGLLMLVSQAVKAEEIWQDKVCTRQSLSGYNWLWYYW